MVAENAMKGGASAEAQPSFAVKVLMPEQRERSEKLLSLLAYKPKDGAEREAALLMLNRIEERERKEHYYSDFSKNFGELSGFITTADRFHALEDFGLEVMARMKNAGGVLVSDDKSDHRFSKAAGFLRSLEQDYERSQALDALSNSAPAITSDARFDNVIGAFSRLVTNEPHYHNVFNIAECFLIKTVHLAHSDAHFARLADLAGQLQTPLFHWTGTIACGLESAAKFIKSPDDITTYGNKIIQLFTLANELDRAADERGNRTYAASDLSKIFNHMETEHKGDFFASEKEFNSFCAVTKACVETGISPSGAYHALRFAQNFRDSDQSFTQAVLTFIDAAKRGIPLDWMNGLMGNVLERLKEAKSEDRPAAIKAYGEAFADYVIKAHNSKVLGRQDWTFIPFKHFSHLLASPEAVADFGDRLIALYIKRMGKATDADAQHTEQYMFTSTLCSFAGIAKTTEDFTKYGLKVEEACAVFDKLGQEKFHISQGLFFAREVVTSEERFNRILDFTLLCAAKSTKDKTVHAESIVLYGLVQGCKGFLTSDARFNRILDYMTASVEAGHEPALSSLEGLQGAITSDASFDKIFDFIVQCEKAGFSAYEIVGMLAQNKLLFASTNRFDRTLQFLTRCMEEKFNPVPSLGQLVAMGGLMASDERFDSLLSLAEAGLPRAWEPATLFEKVRNIADLWGTIESLRSTDNPFGTSDARFARLMKFGMLCTEMKQSSSTAIGALAGSRGLITDDERFSKVLDVAEYSILNGVYPAPLLQFGLPSVSDKISMEARVVGNIISPEDWVAGKIASPEDITKYGKVLVESAKLLPDGQRQEYFRAMYFADCFEALTDAQFLRLISEIKDDAAVKKYFEAITETIAVSKLTQASFLEWYATAYTYGVAQKILPDIVKMMEFSDKHGLCAGEYSIKSDPLVKLLKVERPKEEANVVKTEASLWNEALTSLEAAEKNGFGVVGRAEFERLAAFVSRTGGSPTYLSFASNFVTSKESFDILLSGERGQIDKLILSGVNSHFNNLPGLPSTVEGYGGIEVLRLVWANKEHFRGHERLLTLKNLAETIKTERIHDYGAINQKLPGFNSPYSATYNLTSETGGTRELSKEELDGILTNCNDMVELIFTPPKAKISVKEQFEALSNSVGKGFRGKLNYLWNKHKPDEKTDFVSLRDFARALKELEKDLKSLEKSDAERYAKAIYAHGEILNAVEAEFARKYYEEKLKEKPATDIFSAQEVLGLVFQYVQDPDFHGVASPGRRLLFSDCSKIISHDSRILGEAIPSTGIMVVKSWDRSLNDIFGGRYSGDCTAPPNTGEYSGCNFDKNFGWIKDPGTMILNLSWQKEPKGKPVPVGRAYCFAAELGGNPAVFIDSIEFLESFPAGPEVKKAVVQLMKDLANHFNAPVGIDAGAGRISNRPWVNETISGAKLEKRTLDAQKLGDNVYAEHIEVRPDKMAVFIANPTAKKSA